VGEVRCDGHVLRQGMLMMLVQFTLSCLI
jgi:hypothetical protein